MNSDRFPDLLQGLGLRPVLVVGDLMLDYYVHGEVRRQAPEAPVPILSAMQETAVLGGAGGVVANIAGLGAAAHVLGVVGEDSAGEKIKILLRDCGADPRYLTLAADRPTTVKLRFMAGEQLLLRTDYEKTGALAADDEAALIRNIADAMKECGAVILSDYGKGVLTPGVIAAVMAAAQARNIPVLVDPKGRDFTIYRGADYITPNAKELAEATYMPTATREEVIAAAQSLMTSAGVGAVIAKRSEHGMSVISSAGQWHFEATAEEARGVAGAGDTVIATLAVALASGLPVEKAARLANEAAGIVVAQPGTTSITRHELLSVLSGETAGKEISSAASVQKDWGAARSQIDAWKEQGLKVGFTNGCFDILHYGHVNYLERARRRCDRLVVGLNADASIARLKGADRPVHEEMSRAAVLAALESVDMVVIFGDDPADDDKPLRLIETLAPDRGFKGGDYRIEDLPEAKLIQGYGGTFEIMPLYEGHSTTAAIRRMQKSA